MSTSTLVKEVAQKSQEGQLQTPVQFGVKFEDVIDTRSGKGNYSLAQLFDAYIDYMKNANFVYSGDTKPVNTHMSLWIDTSITNHENYGEK